LGDIGDPVTIIVNHSDGNLDQVAGLLVVVVLAAGVFVCLVGTLRSNRWLCNGVE